MASFRLAPGYRAFEAYQATAGFDNTQGRDLLISHEANSIDSDEVQYCKPDNPWKADKASPRTVKMDLDKTTQPKRLHRNNPMVDGDPMQIEGSNMALLHRYHQIFGHISFCRLRDMAKVGVIPKRLETCPTPACSACLYAKATRKPYRGKTRQDYDPIVITTPGGLVSVDQLDSPIPGMVDQMTGILTIKRYKYVTVFVDQASKLGYV